MANLDDVISELRIAIKDFTENQFDYETGDDNVIVSITTLEQALALLKAQEPRVMNIHEVHSRLLQNRIEREPFYVEVKNKFIACMVNESAMDLPDTDLREILYGKTWRCWTSRPTDEQRKATCWEHNILTQKENENG